MNISNMLSTSFFLIFTMLASTQTYALPVTCGDPSLGTRTVTIDPALDGGYCYAQNGNFNGDNFSGLGSGGSDLDLIMKNSDWGTDFIGGATSGSWSFNANLWDAFDELFIAFHFGGGGECNPDAASTKNPNDVAPGPDCEIDPDSFIVQLDSTTNSGTWKTEWGSKWGLSNLYLIGSCEGPDDCASTNVPEPGSLALLALGITGLGFACRRKN